MFTFDICSICGRRVLEDVGKDILGLRRSVSIQVWLYAWGFLYVTNDV